MLCLLTSLMKYKRFSTAYFYVIVISLPLPLLRDLERWLKQCSNEGKFQSGAASVISKMEFRCNENNLFSAAKWQGSDIPPDTRKKLGMTKEFLLLQL